VRTVRPWVWFLLLLASLPTPATADSLELAEREGNLLHRRVVLSGVKRWDRRTQTWNPFLISPRSTTRLYVVNLWSIHCPPCLAEFPLLQRLARAWAADPRVSFLFVADPPEETSQSELTDFWTRSAPTLPAVDPLRSDTAALQKSIPLEVRPVTLLLDDKMIVRQSFVGAVSARNLGSAIERALKALTSEKPVSGSRADQSVAQ